MPHPDAKQDANTKKEISTTNNTLAIYANNPKSNKHINYLEYLNNSQTYELTRNFFGVTLKDNSNKPTSNNNSPQPIIDDMNQCRSFLFNHMSETAATRKQIKSTKNLDKMFQLITRYAGFSMEALEFLIKNNTEFFLCLNSDKIINLLAFVCGYNRILSDNPKKNNDAQYVIIATLFNNRKIAERFLGYTANWNAREDVYAEEMSNYHTPNKKLFMDVFTIILTSNSSKVISALLENFDSYYYQHKNLPGAYMLKVQGIIKTKKINLAALTLSEIAKKRLNDIISFPKNTFLPLKTKIDDIKNLASSYSDISFSMENKVFLKDSQILELFKFLCDYFKTTNFNDVENQNDSEIQKTIWSDIFRNKYFTRQAFGYTAPNNIAPKDLDPNDHTPNSLLIRKFYNQDMFVNTVTLIIQSKSSPAISALIEAMDTAYQGRLPKTLNDIVTEIITQNSLTLDNLELSEVAQWQWNLIVHGNIPGKSTIISPKL